MYNRQGTRNRFAASPLYKFEIIIQILSQIGYYAREAPYNRYYMLLASV
jgi:hypothetical protein